MKKPQWIAINIAIVFILLIYFFGKTTSPFQKSKSLTTNEQNTASISAVSIDNILGSAKKQLSQPQLNKISALEKSLSATGSPNLPEAKGQEIKTYHQLAHYWLDSGGFFEPYAWYMAEAARLENSEKSLNFAAQLFLENLQGDEETERRRWKALEAKDLFERSLKINPSNDSAKVGLGACYLFGNISATPMEGIAKIREVAERDSNNVFAQMTLAKGSVMSGQYEKAISRLLAVHRVDTSNAEAVLLLADVYERLNDKTNAAYWYQQSLSYIQRQNVRAEIEKRIKELKQ